MTQRLNDAQQLITAALRSARAPLVLWSGGRDSQVLLRLTLGVQPDVPVAYFRGFDHPTKHAFADALIADWKFNLVDVQPGFRDVVAKGDQVELIEVYQLAPNVVIYFPLEAEPGYEPDVNALCAIEKLTAPRQTASRYFDCLFIGHRSDDVDPLHGPIPLADFAVERHGVRFVYPLKDWTEDDVWEASSLLGVPQNVARYFGRDMGANADYWPLCTKCLQPGAGRRVMCPKINDWVYGLGDLLNLEERRANWRQRFVNLEGDNHEHQ